MQSQQPEDDCCGQLTHVVEIEHLHSCINDICDNSKTSVASKHAVDDFNKVVSKYQEQAALLDPHLEALITPLTVALGSIATKAQQQTLDNEDLQHLQAVCQMLWRLCNARGYKVVAKFLDNKAQSLEPAVQLLWHLQQQEDNGRWVWESLYVVLLWCSLLVLAPFHLSVLDSAATDRNALPPLVEKLLSICRAQLGRPTSVRDVSGVVLAKLLTRTDMASTLDEFATWAQGCLESSGSAAAFLIPGCMRALAEIFETGDRQLLRPVAQRLWPTVSAFIDSQQAASSVLARKLATKLLQRLALTMLPAHVVPWRYQRQLKSWQGNSSKANTVKQEAAAADEEPDPEVCDEIEEAVQLLLAGLSDKDSIVRWSAAKGISRITARLPKDLGDEVVEAMLEHFSDYSSDTCWHGTCLALAEFAQRGLLLPTRLPSVLPLVAKALHYDQRRGAHSVGSHVRDAAAYVCWACARAYEPCVMEEGMGVLGPALMITACYDREVNCRRAASAAFQECVGRLGNVPHGIDIVTVADYFTLSNRAQAALQVAPQVARYNQYAQQMAEHLLHVKLRHWDPAVRQLAARALGAVVPFVGPWLASTGMAALVQSVLDPALEVRDGSVWGIAELLPALGCAALLSNSPHGAAVARIPSQLTAAHYLQGKGGETMRLAVSQLIKRCSEVQLQGAAGEVSSWLTVLDSSLSHPAPQVQLMAAAALREFASGRPAANGAHMAGEWVLLRCRVYLCSALLTSGSQAQDHSSAKALLQKYRDALAATDNSPLARGGALALGALPGPLLAPDWQTVVHALCCAIEPKDHQEQQPQPVGKTSGGCAVALAASRAGVEIASDIDVRVNALHALALVCCTLAGTTPSSLTAAATTQQETGSSSCPQQLLEQLPGAGSTAVVPLQELEHMLVQQVLPRVLAGTSDYTTDNRGDVGSWVREAAMTTLTTLMLLLHRLTIAPASNSGAAAAKAVAAVGSGAPAPTLPAPLLVQAVCALLKQSVERIAKLRQAALSHLRQLQQAGLTASQPWGSALQSAASQALAADVTEPAPTLTAMATVLQIAPLRGAVLEGLVASIGGVDQQLAHAATDAVETACEAATKAGVAANEHDCACDLRLALIIELNGLWSAADRASRLSTPFICTAEQLLAAALVVIDPDSLTDRSAQGLAAWHAALGSMLECCRNEIKGCKDVARLAAAARLLCQIMSWGGPSCSPALLSAVRLLVSRFPKVRMQCAEALYMQLLAPSMAAQAALGLSEDVFEQASSLVESTDWADGEASAAVVLQMCELLMLPKVEPAKRKAMGGLGQAAIHAVAGAASAYQALIDNLSKGY